MPEFTVIVSEEAAESVRRTARSRRIAETECVEQIIEAHHDEFRRFPDGVLAAGRAKLCALISEIPGVSEVESSGVAYRHWWISFVMNWDVPTARAVVRHLGLLLNTKATEMMLSTVFFPVPNEWPDKPLQWQIASTAPLLDPADVEAWLRQNLPKPLNDPLAWTAPE